MIYYMTGRGMKMIIRKAEKKDVRQIAQIVVEDWKTAYRGIMDDRFLDALDAEKRYQTEIKRYQEYTVAADQEEVLGFAWNRLIDDEVTDCEIVALYVRYSKRKNGIGKALLRDAVDRFRERGRKRMIIWCLRENDEARRFYEKTGGVLYGSGTHRWGDREYDMVSYLYSLDG